MYNKDADLVFSKISYLRRTSAIDNPEVYWADFISVASKLCYSQKVCLLSISSGESRNLSVIRVSGTDSTNQTVPIYTPDISSKSLQIIVARAIKNGFAMEQGSITLLAFKLAQIDDIIFIIELPYERNDLLKDIVVRGRLLADLPSNIAIKNINDRKIDNSLSGLLSILPSIYSSDSLSLAGLRLVNDLVSISPDIDQAVIGWCKGGAILISQISHVDKIDRGLELSNLFESTLEEAFDQKANIAISSNSSSYVRVAHEKLKRSIGCDDLYSMVIYGDDNKAIGCLLLVKMRGCFSVELNDALSFLLSISAPKLEYLYTKSLSIVDRLKIGAEKYLEIILGGNLIWTKLISLVSVLFLAWLFLGSISFRIESTGEFDTDKTIMISASQDGVVSDVLYDIGEEVVENSTVIELKKQDLVLQLTELEAEKQRYITEADKAMAINNIVDVEIYNARKLQAEAKIRRVKLKITDAVMLAPFDGIVVEGEKKNLIGLPVRKGDTLMKIARLEGLYLTLLVDERDIHFVELGDRGEFSLVSQPLTPISFSVERIVPMASSSGNGTGFQVKAKLITEPESWWRPGMTGIAKIDKGDRAPYWVFGHKAYYQLRLLMWW